MVETTALYEILQCLPTARSNSLEAAKWGLLFYICASWVSQWCSSCQSLLIRYYTAVLCPIHPLCLVQGRKGQLSAGVRVCVCPSSCVSATVHLLYRLQKMAL